MPLYKLIVNTPPGPQEVVQVEKSGDYFDKNLVIWDERTQGPIPADMLKKVGALIKDPLNGKLKEDAAKKKQNDEAIERINALKPK